jgi:Tol biopolymer transport system component
MSIDRLERRLPDVLGELAPPAEPDYLDDLLGRTARMPQRPGWSFLERWIPVSTIALPRSTIRLPLRLLIAVALVLALVAASIALYAGSQPKLPPVFGPAGNGLFVTSETDGIVTIDPATGKRSTIVAGKDLCCLTVSPDGQWVFYVSDTPAPADPAGVSVIRLDGSDQRSLPAELLKGFVNYSWSRTDDRALVVYGGGVVTFDAKSGAVVHLDLPSHATAAEWIGITGDILVSTRPSDTAPIRVYRVPADGSSPTELTDLTDAVGEPLLSPDGSRFAYFIWGPTDALHGRVHVFDVATGVDTAITPEDEASNADPHAVEGIVWSPDGSLIASNWFGKGFDQIALLPAAGGDPVFVGPRLAENALTGDHGMEFAPDGRSLLVQYPGATGTWLLPVDGSPGRQLPWSISTTGYDWQRVAP